MRGLTAVLNEHAQQIKKDKKYDVADVYEIKFEEGAGIENAAPIRPSSTTKLARSGFPDQVQGSFAYHTPKEGTANGKTKYNKDYKWSRIFSVQSGMSVTQLIKLLVDTSEYVTDQVDQITDENTRKVLPNDKDPKRLTMFKITPEVELLQFDPKRNDFAYKITYVISKTLARTESPYVPQANKTCYGVHKKFDYWFTGNNTEVLNFEQDYNLLWFNSIGANYDPSNLDYQVNVGTIIKTFFQTNSTHSTQGGTNRTTEAAASISSDLYSPGDQGNIELTIVGDPDFLAQSEIFYSPSVRLNSEYKHSPFLEDGSVNVDVSDIFFSLNYNTVVDYDLETGIADTTKENFGRDIASGKPGLVRHSFIYRANTITTELNEGQFVQILRGSLMPIPKHCLEGKQLELLEDAIQRDIDEGAIKARVKSGRIDNSAELGPTAIASAPKYPDDKATSIDLLKPNANQPDEIVINNNVALDTPRLDAADIDVTGNTTPAPELDDYNYNEHLVNSDDGILGDIRRTAGRVVDTTGRITKDVFAKVDTILEDRKPNNIDDFNDGG